MKKLVLLSMLLWSCGDCGQGNTDSGRLNVCEQEDIKTGQDGNRYCVLRQAQVQIDGYECPNPLMGPYALGDDALICTEAFCNDGQCSPVFDDQGIVECSNEGSFTTEDLQCVYEECATTTTRTIERCMGGLLVNEKTSKSCPTQVTTGRGCDDGAGYCQFDQCVPEQTCLYENGLQCGDKDGNDAQNLYRCNGGGHMLVDVCDNGCQPRVEQTDAQCKTAMCTEHQWSLQEQTVTMQTGVQRLGEPFDVRLDVELRTRPSDIEFRVCKYVNDVLDNFIGEPIHVWFFPTQGSLAFTDVFRADVDTLDNEPCTQWTGLGLDFDALNNPDSFGGQVRVVSPARVNGDWMQDCGNPNVGGYCWYSTNVGVFEHTCP